MIAVGSRLQYVSCCAVRLCICSAKATIDVQQEMIAKMQALPITWSLDLEYRIA